MVCSNCGYALGPDDQYCGGCGAFLTDAPEDEPGQGHPEAGDLGAAAHTSAVGDTAPQESPWDTPDAPAQQPAPARSMPSAGLVAAALAALVLIALLLLWVLRPDGEESLASGTTTTGSAATAPATTDGAAPPPTDTPSGTPTETPTEQPTSTPIELPGSAEQCNNVGAFVVYRGNTTTSCPFAENVGRAFAGLAQPVTAEVALTGVSSPVTGLDYDLTCEFTTPVRCAGGNDAVVYLVPAS